MPEQPETIDGMPEILNWTTTCKPIDDSAFSIVPPGSTISYGDQPGVLIPEGTRCIHIKIDGTTDVASFEFEPAPPVGGA